MLLVVGSEDNSWKTVTVQCLAPSFHVLFSAPFLSTLIFPSVSLFMPAAWVGGRVILTAGGRRKGVTHRAREECLEITHGLLFTDLEYLFYY